MCRLTMALKLVSTLENHAHDECKTKVILPTAKHTVILSVMKMACTGDVVQEHE